MTILFFLTTLITGIFLGIIALAGVIAIIIRKEDQRNERLSTRLGDSRSTIVKTREDKDVNLYFK